MTQWIAEVAWKSDPPGIAWQWRVSAVAFVSNPGEGHVNRITPCLCPFDGVYDRMVTPGQVLVMEPERFVHWSGGGEKDW
jgi:hypothetical protein